MSAHALRIGAPSPPCTDIPPPFVHLHYRTTGTSDNPEPRIRIVFSSASSGSDSYSDSTDSSSRGLPFTRLQAGGRHSPSSNSGSGSGSNPRFTELPDSSEDETKPTTTTGESSEVASASAADEIEGDFEGAGPQANQLLKKMYGMGVHSDDEGEGEVEEAERDWSSVGVDVDPRGVERRKSDETLRWEGLSREEKEEEATRAEKERVRAERAENADEEADDEGVVEKGPRK